jgi:hypothetical protein
MSSDLDTPLPWSFKVVQQLAGLYDVSIEAVQWLYSTMWDLNAIGDIDNSTLLAEEMINFLDDAAADGKILHGLIVGQDDDLIYDIALHIL